MMDVEQRDREMRRGRQRNTSTPNTYTKGEVEERRTPDAQRPDAVCARGWCVLAHCWGHTVRHTERGATRNITIMTGRCVCVTRLPKLARRNGLIIISNQESNNSSGDHTANYFGVVGDSYTAGRSTSAREHLRSMFVNHRAAAAPLLQAPPISVHRCSSPSASSAPSPPPLSGPLLLADSGMLSLYSMSASITGLFTSGEYLEPPGLAVSAQDFVEISLAFDQAAALALGWCVASALTGIVCSESWFNIEGDEHRQAPLGIAGLLSNWVVSWPLGIALKATAAYGLALTHSASVVSSAGSLVYFLGASSYATDPASAAADLVLRTAGSDGAGALLVLTLWRTWLLRWTGRLR